LQNGDVEQCKVNWLNRENYSSNDHEIVSLLLDAGSDPNSANFKGRSALHYAVINGRLDIVQLLLRAGARLVDPDVNGDTPRDLAAKSDNDSVRSFMVSIVLCYTIQICFLIFQNFFPGN
jgi:ankyrin repeat protein